MYPVTIDVEIHCCVYCLSMYFDACPSLVIFTRKLMSCWSLVLSTALGLLQKKPHTPRGRQLNFHSYPSRKSGHLRPLQGLGFFCHPPCKMWVHCTSRNSKTWNASFPVRKCVAAHPCGVDFSGTAVSSSPVLFCPPYVWDENFCRGFTNSMTVLYEIPS